MAIALTAVGLFGVFTARQTLGHSLAVSSPELLAQIHRYPVRAWTERAKRAVANPEDKARVRLGRSYAIMALRASPVQPGALGAIASADMALGDQGRSDAVLAVALKISRREPVVNMLEVSRAVRTGDVNAMAESADVAMRANRVAASDLWPALIQESVEPKFAKALAVRLATNPLWRTRFLETAGLARDFPQAGENLFLALKDLGSGPTQAEVAPYFMSAGRARGRITALRDLWRRIDPDVDQKMAVLPVYDGGFTGAAGSRPFNWIFGDQYNLSAVIERDGPNSWLAIRFGGEELGYAARQLLALKPGAYRLMVTHRAIDGLNTSALRVALSCHDGKGIARQDIQATYQKRRMAMTFVVPQTCDGQWLELTVPSELGDMAPRALAIDDIAIEASR